jgi:L-iditol 2-dehydrogenase
LKAVVKDRPEPGIAVKEIPKPHLAPDEVLLRVYRASICGSDIGLYNYTAAYAGFAKLPIVPGHEYAGEIVEVGSEPTEFKIGERVVGESILSCRTCKFCRWGQTNLCLNFKIFGMHTNGGFSEYVNVPVRHVHGLRDEITFQEAALIEPLSVACHALLDVTSVEPTDFVTVLGPGPIGLLAAQVARASGSQDTLVVGIDVDAVRLDIARRLGFATINAKEKSPIERTKELTGGVGADIAVVAAGSGEALIQACELVRKGGRVVNIGIFAKPVELTITSLVRRQVSICGTFASTWKNYEQAMDLAAKKKVTLKPLVTHEYPIDKARSAFEVANSREGCKVQLSF